MKDPVARQILDVVPHVMRTIAADLRRTNHLAMSAHFRVLWILEHRVVSLSQLAEMQAVSLPTMSNSVTILEERGWARRTRSVEDRRKVVIKITPEGRKVLDEARQIMEANVADLIAPLSAADRTALAQGLEVLRTVFVIQPECKDEG
jgi:DNA-binding MarR family transcriptional regulator